ncbi:MAG TPA: hypothetical protein VGO59_18335 [Verrucomicrobiae bacterium]|jgi:hypothetical protein
MRREHNPSGNPQVKPRFFAWIFEKYIMLRRNHLQDSRSKIWPFLQKTTSPVEEKCTFRKRFFVFFAIANSQCTGHKPLAD